MRGGEEDMRYWLIFVVQFLLITAIEAQVDSSMIDSMEDRITRDNLIEQTTPVENSNFLDELQADDSSGKSRFSVRSRLESMLQPAAGYTEGKYIGSRLHSYQKLMWVPRAGWQTGILFEKDPGEGKINDFTSFHLSVENLGFISHCILGDYLVESGQGVSLWRSYDYTKGADIVKPLLREGRNLVPYLSSNEQNFLRGGAASGAVGPVSLMIFYSRKKLSSVLNSAGEIEALYTSGEFRTSTEAGHRDNASEELFGGKFNYSFSNASRVGLLLVDSRFSRSLNLSTLQLSGKRFSILAADYDIQIHPLRTFGEWVVSNHTLGGIGSVILSAGHSTRCIVSCRYYPTGLFSLHGLGFGDGVETSNETGLYAGCEIEPRRGISLRVFYDQFSSLSPSHSSFFPSSGHEYFFTAQTVPFDRARLEIQYRQKVSQVSSNFSLDGMHILYDDVSKYSCRIEMTHVLNNAVTIAGRWEYHEQHYRLHDQPEYGALLHTDVRLTPSKVLSLNLRLIIFSTDSYDTRFFEYEKNFDGAVSIPAVYGEGIKWYVLVEFRPSDRITVGMKYSDLIRDDTRHIGSGLDELPANHDNRVGIQMDLHL
jgi:hypothetical protein